MTDTKWTGFQPAGIEQNVADHVFLKILHEEGAWDKANDAWQSQLMPIGGLVRRQDGYHGIVVNVYQDCFFTWPAVEIKPLVWREDHSAARLRYHACFNLDDWRVLPTQVVSPVRLFLEDPSEFNS